MRSALFQAPEPRERWSAHLREVFQSLEIPVGPVADNLAESIALYCQTFHPRGLKSADLRLLVARAFCAVGDRAAARRALESSAPHARHVERWLEVLSELHHFPQMLPFFSRGIVRPADWAGAQLDRMWTLDFNPLAPSGAERHEIVLYRTVRLLLEKMFVFWDAVRGEGTLGLKGLPALAPMPQDEVLEYIADLFQRQREPRGWTAVPTLLNLG